MGGSRGKTKASTRAAQATPCATSESRQIRSSQRAVRRTAKAAQYHDNRLKKKARTTPLALPRPPPTPSSLYDKLTPRTPSLSAPGRSDTKEVAERPLSSVRQNEPATKKLDQWFEDDVQSTEKEEAEDECKKQEEHKDDEQEGQEQNCQPSPPFKFVDEQNKYPNNNNSNKADDSAQTVDKSNTSSQPDSKRRGKKLELPAILANASVCILCMIDDKLNHDALKFPRRTCTDSASLTMGFPLYGTQICREDFKHLSTDPKSFTGDIEELFAGYAILDLATQWTFWNTSSHASWCPLPACTFELAKGGKNTILQQILQRHNLEQRILKSDVIEITVYHASHFSKAFVLYAERVIDRRYKTHDKDDDRLPCILYANSGVCGRIHNSMEVAKTIRTFLNSYDKFVNQSSGRSFTHSSLPDFPLSVPEQGNGWSCGYHTAFFQYDIGEVLEIRRDLLTVAQYLKVFKDQQLELGSGADDGFFDFDFVNWAKGDLENPQDLEMGDFAPFFKSEEVKRPVFRKEARSVTAKKKTLHSAILRSRKEEEQQKSERFHGKLNSKHREDTKELIAQIRRPPERIIGMPAVNLESYKDKMFRRQLHSFSKATIQFQKIARYESESANRRMPRCVSVGMLKDAVGPYPDRKGEKYDPIRVSPLRIAMATTRSEFNDFVDDLIANRDKYILMTDPEKIDEEVLGNERPPLEEF